MRVYPVISVTNNSNYITDQDVSDIVIALQHQVSYHFKPFWDSGANLKFTGHKPLPDTWELAFLNDSDQAGALGYHDIDPKAKPLAKVFVATDKQYGYSPAITAGHEVLEMLADPYVNLAAQTSNTEFYGYEVGDPCEADQFGYKINIGTKLAPHYIDATDFVLPNWFIPGAPTRYDYCGYISEPLEVLDGGYCSIFTSGEGWSMKQMQKGKLVDVTKDNADEPRFRNRV